MFIIRMIDSGTQTFASYFEADIENGDPLQCKQLSKFTSNPNSSTSRSTWYIFQPYSNVTIVFIF